MLAAALPAQTTRMLSFAVDDDAVRALAARVIAWLEAGAQLRQRARSALVATVREHWSWEGVARGVIAAAQGQLEGLQEPGSPAAGQGGDRPGARTFG